MKRPQSLPEAVLRLQALISVLDEELRLPSPPIPLPERLRHLTGKAGSEARLSLRFLAHSLDEMERYVDEARQSAEHWRRRSVASWELGEYHLAAQARQRIVEAEQELQLYEEEIAAVRRLLQQCTDAQIDWAKQ